MTTLPIVQDRTIPQPLPQGTGFTAPAPRHFKKRYMKDEWQAHVSDALHGKQVKDVAARIRTRFREACERMPSAKSRQAMVLALNLNKQSWVDMAIGVIVNRSMRDFSPNEGLKITDMTPEVLTEAYAKTLQPGLIRIDQDATILCDPMLYDARSNHDDIISRARSVILSETVVRELLYRTLGIRIAAEENHNHQHGGIKEVLEGRTTVAAILKAENAEKTEYATVSDDRSDERRSEAHAMVSTIRQHRLDGGSLHQVSVSRLLNTLPMVRSASMSEAKGFEVFSTSGFRYSGNSYNEFLANLLADGNGLHFEKSGQRYALHLPHNWHADALFSLPLRDPSRKEQECQSLDRLRQSAKGIKDETQFLTTWNGLITDTTAPILINAMRVELGGAWASTSEEIPALWHRQIHYDSAAAMDSFRDEVVAESMVNDLTHMAALYASKEAFILHVWSDFCEFFPHMPLDRCLLLQATSMDAIWACAQEYPEHNRNQAYDQGYVLPRRETLSAFMEMAAPAA